MADRTPLPPYGVYETPINQELQNALVEIRADGAQVTTNSLPAGDAPLILADYVAELVRKRLEDAPATERLTIANKVISSVLEDDATWAVIPSAQESILLEIAPPAGQSLASGPRQRPELPLRQSDLLLNARGEPNLVRLIRSEMASADHLRIIMSFIKWPGLRLIQEPLQQALDRGVRVQVLTTTYMGASDERAVTELVRMGAEVRISYDERGTRLHAKAWLFDRSSGLHTGYVGSSNLSAPAMTDGLEWNVRLAGAETPHLLDKFRAAFDAYWSDPNQGFESYDPVHHPEHRERLQTALAPRQAGGLSEDWKVRAFDIRPWRYQQEMLDALERERFVHGRNRSLLVAATGTGKTMIAAFDYARLSALWRERGASRRPRMLFIAHRESILKQALHTYRHVLRDSSFGELLVDGEVPARGEHVFASVQSLTSGGRLDALDPEHFEIVVVDEFHHAAASAWDRILKTLTPRFLLGLTATPERMDGKDVTAWFDGRIAAELRLWEALEQGLLSPFHYFAIGNEQLDFSQLAWRGGRYDAEEVQRLFTGNDIIMRWVFREIEDKVASPQRMRALVFVSGLKHASYVAQYLSARGIAAEALSGVTDTGTREAARRRLIDGSLQAIVTVDLFNEGVDIPEIDTVIMLRPTESATVFLQQLGRGLRKANGKSVLTVLDFVGHHRKEFRFDVRLRALTGVSRTAIPDAIEKGFPYLPAGTQIQLDSVAAKLVLENIRAALPQSAGPLALDISEHARGRSALEYSLTEYLRESGLSLEEVYGKANRSWLRLQQRAGLASALVVPDGSAALRVRSLLHVDDAERLDAYQELLTDAGLAAGIDRADPRMQKFAEMLYVSTYHKQLHGDLSEGLLAMQADRCFVQEALQAWQVSREAVPYATRALQGALAGLPLAVHAHYSRAEMLAALGLAGIERPASWSREGVYFLRSLGVDAFNFSFAKSAERYSPQTLYRDFAISDELIHWQSQNGDSQNSPKIRRYVSHRELNHRILLFARESDDYVFGSRPYLFLGEAEYVSHEGNRPVSFVWRLKERMPADFVGSSQLLAG